MYLLAPNMQAFSQQDYDGPLHNEANQPPSVPMTGLQITMSREIGGWPLYTIVIGLGQVCFGGLICLNEYLYNHFRC
jgi:alpha-1,3-glucan synthase